MPFFALSSFNCFCLLQSCLLLFLPSKSHAFFCFAFFCFAFICFDFFILTFFSSCLLKAMPSFVCLLHPYLLLCLPSSKTTYIGLLHSWPLYMCLLIIVPSVRAFSHACSLPRRKLSGLKLFAHSLAVPLSLSVSLS